MKYVSEILEKFGDGPEVTTTAIACALEQSSYRIRGSLNSMRKSGKALLVSEGKCGRGGFPATWVIIRYPKQKPTKKQCEELAAILRGAFSSC